MPTIYPTNTCFDDALDYIDIRLNDGTATNLILIHAICLIPKGQLNENIPYAHAWVEENDKVMCAGIIEGHKIYYVFSCEEYRHQLRIQYEHRYTIGQALAENWKSGYYGPWDEKIIPLAARRGSLIPSNKDDKRIPKNVT